MTDERNQPSQPAFTQTGVGLQATRGCLGCGHWRSLIGSAGKGAAWRCMPCLAARRAKAESKPSTEEAQ